MSSRPTSATDATGSPAPPARTALIWTALALVYLFWGSTYLGIRVAVESLPPLTSAAMRFAAAGLVLALVLRLWRGPGSLRVPPRRLGSAALVGVLLLAGSLIAFTAYVWLLAHAPISLVSTYAYVNPAVAVALGALLVAEPVTAQVLLGGAVIVAGVAVVVSTERPRRTAPAAVEGAARKPAGR
ncbi:EamA family transporter [Micromonospora sp. NPDC049282]|uniref:EamA family transporter n=1 Tax=Micromonospora sp. NPDC049282 TaxID=3364269 RepID=UPI003722F2E1